MKWNDVQLYQFNNLQEALKIENEEDRVFEVARAIFGDEVLNLPIAEFTQKVKELDFLKEPMPTNVPPKKITVNGRKYFLACLLGNVSTAQYVDFVNHSKTDNIAQMLSVFVIPEGHSYNDGYDMMEVINDIYNLPITVVNDMAFFFGRQFNASMKIFQSYSIKQIKKTSLPKEMKKKMIEIVKGSVDLASFPLS